MADITHGPNAQDVVERLRATEASATLSFGMGDEPPVMERAAGAIIFDPDGNEYLDMVAGFGSLNLGHSHPAIVAAVTRQMALGQQAMSMVSVTRTDLIERLSGLVHPGHKVVLGGTGSEAVETALKMVRRATGRTGVVAFTGGFHGRTMGALTLMGKISQRRGLGSLIGEVYHLPYPDPYRSPLAVGGDVGDATIALLRSYLDDPASGWAEIGAVIIEPVQGNGGMIPAPPGFMRALREVCTEYGVLLISDEVMSGFHRTGRLFAYQHDTDVAPDIIVLGKSVSAGLPLSAVLVTESVAAASPPVTESSTYAGNLVSCAAALAALDVYDQDDMSARAATLGDVLLERFGAEFDDHPNVGTIRGRGLMAAIELVHDRESKRPLEVARAVSEACLRRGLLVYPGGHYANAVGVLPPLIATEEQLADAAGRIRAAVAEVVAP